MKFKRGDYAFTGRGRRLTDRERELVILLAQGNSYKDIAQRLNITYKTVAVHFQNIRLKLGLHDIVGLVAWAVRTGLVQIEPEPGHRRRSTNGERKHNDDE